MRVACAVSLLLVLAFVPAGTGNAFEAEPYQMVEDVGVHPWAQCALQHYYYIPCPSDSWFWGVSGWAIGDIIGAHFRVDQQSTGRVEPCCECCYVVVGVSILDFAGYGTVYPGWFSVTPKFFCADENGYPTGPAVYSGPPIDTSYGWNYIDFDRGFEPPCFLPGTRYESFVVTITFTGLQGIYPAIGFDNIGTAQESGCEMRDIGGSLAEYPRNWAGGPEPRVHSGYVGWRDFEHWPPIGFADGGDTTRVTPEFGFSEVAWRVHLSCGWG